MRCFSNLLKGFCAVLFLTAPLSAQLNPKWQAANAPDFLDLYQSSSGTKVKPEIVTIFDFSGSMQSLMYHPCYYNSNTNDNGDIYGITFSLTGGAGSMVVTAKIVYTDPLDASKNETWSTVQLIRPDGSLVTENIVNTTSSGTGLWGDKYDTGASTQACDVRNWVRAASHIRLTKSISDNGKTRVRTIDLPIPWKVMDANSTGCPLTSMTVNDSQSGTNIEVDTRYNVQTGFGDVAPSTSIRDNNIVLSGDQDKIVTTTTFNIRLSKDYLHWLFQGKYQNTDPKKPDYNSLLSGQYIVFDAVDNNGVGLQTRVNQGQGFGNLYSSETALKALVLPARDRVQAVKEAAIRTWIKYQNQVYWAYRFLDDEDEAGDGSAAQIDADSRKTINASDPTKTWVNGRDTGWTVLNNNSVNGMKRLAAMFPYTNTPLCYALARTLAQLSNPVNVFSDVETSPYPVECQRRFVILFTDGVPTKDAGSDGHDDTPYIDTTGGATGSALNGNTTLLGDKDSINPGKKWWNIYTYAAVAAHLSDNGRGWDSKYTMAPLDPFPSGSQAPSKFLPFAVAKRGTLPLDQQYGRITTMTVGVSLGGDTTAGPKRRLMLTAAVGDQDSISWDLNTLKPFALKDPLHPDDPNNGKATDSTYFFDAGTPDSLVNYLGQAFYAAINSPQTASTSVPVIPWIGGGLSNQIYLASFTVPPTASPVWKGDLRMFPTQEGTSETVILGLDGLPVPGDLSQTTNFGWSAADILTKGNWRDRKIYTRLSATSSIPNPKIYPIPTSLTTTDLDTGSNKDLAAVLPGADTATKLKNIQWMMGADPDKGTTRDTIMGDILDSAPAFLEYSIPSTSSMTGPLLTAWGDSTKQNKHFRVIYVGTNQGVIHAFGEVSYDNTIGSGSSAKTIKAAVVAELWAFIPTDILKFCDYYRNSANPHRMGVNGTPYLYFLDLPADGKRSGNGKMDIGSTSERATLIMGLGKGGRSYYAIDVRDPFAPKLGVDGNGWALVPDEVESYPASIFETQEKKTSIISNMGWATCQPTVARVFTGTAGNNLRVRDVVMLGGGFSLPAIEPTDKDGNKIPLGRSALALDVTNGHIVNFWDLSSNSAVGPVGAGVMPMQVTNYSGLTQRAYFTDFWGGLWALGGTSVQGGSGDKKDFRVDTSYISDWGCRPVYHQSYPNGFLSTMPAPFLVSNFYPRTDDPKLVPTTVGIALVSGDRNNPMDHFYTTGYPEPTQHRLSVVFDRQDSKLLGLDSNGINGDTQMADVSTMTTSDSAVFTPGDSKFFLKDKYGYYINFAKRGDTEQYVTKGLVTPIVLSGKLFFSYFSPTNSANANPCDPATGVTKTADVCNVLKPLFPGTGAATKTDEQGCIYGEVFTWIGVSSKFSPKSILAVLQAGMLPSTDPAKPDMKIKSFQGAIDKALAGPKVWRTVH